MKRFFAILVAIALSSCASPSSPVQSGQAHTKIVVNSKWNVVKAQAFTKGIDEDVATYNATHTDDQQFIYVDTVPPVEQAPYATVYIVNPTTHEIYQEFSGNYTENTGTHGPAIERTRLIRDYEAWKLQALMVAGTLYVDNIPPVVPAAPDLRSLDEKYIIYGLDADGHILYSQHCYDPANPDLDTEAKAKQMIYMVRQAYTLTEGVVSIVEGHYYIDQTI